MENFKERKAIQIHYKEITGWWRRIFAMSELPSIIRILQSQHLSSLLKYDIHRDVLSGNLVKISL